MSQRLWTMYCPCSLDRIASMCFWRHWHSFTFLPWQSSIIDVIDTYLYLHWQSFYRCWYLDIFWDSFGLLDILWGLLLIVDVEAYSCARSWANLGRNCILLGWRLSDSCWCWQCIWVIFGQLTIKYQNRYLQLKTTLLTSFCILGMRRRIIILRSITLIEFLLDFEVYKSTMLTTSSLGTIFLAILGKSWILRFMRLRDSILYVDLYLCHCRIHFLYFLCFFDKLRDVQKSGSRWLKVRKI